MRGKLAPVYIVVIISLVIFAYNFTSFAHKLIGRVKCGETVKIYENIFSGPHPPLVTVTVTVSDYCKDLDSELELFGTDTTSTFVTIPDGNTITRTIPVKSIDLKCKGNKGFCIYKIEVD